MKLLTEEQRTQLITYGEINARRMADEGEDTVHFSPVVKENWGKTGDGKTGDRENWGRENWGQGKLENWGKLGMENWGQYTINLYL